MPTVYRLSKENYCPVDMVRTAMQDLMSELRGETSRDNQSTNQNAPDSDTVTNQTRGSLSERKRSLRKVYNILRFFDGSKWHLTLWTINFC